jgi:hypothetical protein
VKTTDLEVKTDRPAEMNTQVLELLIEGVRVRVRVAQRRLKSEAEQRAKAAHDEKRIAKSTEIRREKARKHSSLEWLEAAYNVHPGCGAERLMREARKIAAWNGVDETKRDDITEHRAKEYLKSARSK